MVLRVCSSLPRSNVALEGVMIWIACGFLYSNAPSAGPCEPIPGGCGLSPWPGKVWRSDVQLTMALCDRILTVAREMIVALKGPARDGNHSA